ncbi:MAG: transcription elongation factor GreA [Candidatus Pacebacteria bacterium]|jgi:transcription elongation factor GreA|nr:transcription elongation factor GreA [Candidatus Paceibacterota bacterium]
MDQTSYITEEKKQALLEELKTLKTVKRKEIIEALEAAKALGDLSENAEYHQAREDQGKTEDRINQIEYILQSAVVVKRHHSTKVEIGTTVSVRKEGSKDTTTYSIVGAEEADMAQNKISHKSPLGEAIFGKSKGDVVSISTPKGLVKYTLVDIQ